MKGAIYSRVSTENQEYKRQTEELSEYAKRNGIEITHIFEEKESGFNKDRPQFKKLCKLTKEDIDIVLVYELSRISRRAVHLQEVVEEFTRKGINVYAKKENLHTLKQDGTVDQMTQLTIAIVATMAQQEAATFKARSASGKDHKIINEGKHPFHIPPYGYYFDKTTKQIYIDEKEREIVELIFDLSIKGFGLVDIALQLEAKGFAPRRSNKWRKNTIRGVIINKIYTGHFDYKGHNLTAPQIISEETYQLANEKLHERKKTSVGRALYGHLLRGMIICPYCGLRYSYRNLRNTYVCSSKSLKKIDGGCIGKNIAARNLDYMIWEIILLAHKDSLIKKRQQDQLKPINEQLKEINGNIENLQKVIDKRDKESAKIIETAIQLKMKNLDDMANNVLSKLDNIKIEIEKYKEKIAGFEAQKNSLTKRIEAIESNAKIVITDAVEKKEIIHQMIAKIVPYNHGISSVITVHFKSGEQYNIIYTNTGGKRYYAIFNNSLIRYNFPHDYKKKYGEEIADFTIPSPLNNIIEEKDVKDYSFSELHALIKEKKLERDMPILTK